MSVNHGVSDIEALVREEKRLTAYHEAGHAVVGLSVPSGIPVHKATIIPRGRALGVTMYHLLTGAPPFQADSIPRLMDKIVHQKHHPVADLRDDVPPIVDVILDRALAKNPADRYESGKAMALALRECCSTFPSDIV